MKFWLAIVITFIGVIVSFWLSGSNEGQASQELRVTGMHRAIASESQWLNVARKLEAEDLRGRIILLDFWTFCCINCIHIVPDLLYLEEKFAEKLTVIGVHSAKFQNEKDSENIRAAVLRYGIEHPVVNDADFKIWRQFGVRAWPTLILINPEGKIEQVYSGEGHRQKIEDDVKELISKYEDDLNKEPLPIELEKSKVAETVLSFPGKLALGKAVSAYGNQDILFIADSSNDRVLAADITGNVLEVIGGGKRGYQDGDFTSAQFNKPQGLLYSDNKLYVADTANHTLRLIDLKTKNVSTIAGTGKQGYDRTIQGKNALKAELASPWDLAFFHSHDEIAIAMAGTHQLWTYDIKNKTVSVLAGNGRESIDDGKYPFNSLSQPSGLSSYGGVLYFVDSETSSLRKLDQDKSITTLIGTGLFDFGFADGKQGKALLQHSLGVFADESEVYIADSYNHAIRKYSPDSGELITISGDGERGNDNAAIKNSQYNEPNDIIKHGDKFYIADTNNHLIRVIDINDNTVSNLSIKIAAGEEVENNSPQLWERGDLPNLREAKSPPALKAGDDLLLKIQHLPGWKINDEAPSWLNLFEVNDESVKILHAYGAEELKKSDTLKLPKLDEGKSYRIQGTIYHCKDEVGSLCLIQSYDQAFSVLEENSSREIVIELVAPGR